VIPLEISQHLPEELRLRLERAAESEDVARELARLSERARAEGAGPDAIALAAGVVLALASKTGTAA
jgi:hypothetical protein